MTKSHDNGIKGHNCKIKGQKLLKNLHKISRLLIKRQNDKFEKSKLWDDKIKIMPKKIKN